MCGHSSFDVWSPTSGMTVPFWCEAKTWTNDDLSYLFFFLFLLQLKWTPICHFHMCSYNIGWKMYMNSFTLLNFYWSQLRRASARPAKQSIVRIIRKKFCSKSMHYSSMPQLQRRFNWTDVDCRAWISSYIPHKTMDTINYRHSN